MQRTHAPYEHAGHRTEGRSLGVNWSQQTGHDSVSDAFSLRGIFFPQSSQEKAAKQRAETSTGSLDRLELDLRINWRTRFHTTKPSRSKERSLSTGYWGAYSFILNNAMGCIRSKPLRVTPLIWQKNPMTSETSSSSDGLLASGWLVVDKNGVLTAQSHEIVQMLGSSHIGLELKAIMNDALATLHLAHILPAYSRTLDRSTWNHVIGQHVRRRSSLKDVQGNAVDIEVTVGVEALNSPEDYQFLLRISPLQIHRAGLDFNRRRLLALRLSLRGTQQTRKASMAILVIDIVNSTEVLINSPNKSYIHHVALQTAVKHLLIGHYDPLVTLYETVGDSMLFVTLPGEAPALVRRPKCKTLVDFASDLMKESTRIEVPIRCSASFGEILCTVMDGQVRLFGAPLTTACRLQSFVTPSQGTGVYSSMMLCDTFYQELLSEMKQMPFDEKPSARELRCHLKGFGEDVVCRCLDIGTSFGRQES